MGRSPQISPGRRGAAASMLTGEGMRGCRLILPGSRVSGALALRTAVIGRGFVQIIRGVERRNLRTLLFAVRAFAFPCSGIEQMAVICGMHIAHTWEEDLGLESPSPLHMVVAAAWDDIHDTISIPGPPQGRTGRYSQARIAYAGGGDGADRRPRDPRYGWPL